MGQALRRWHACFALLGVGLAPLIAVGPSRSQSGRPLPTRGRHGMVASSSQLASQVGVDVLKRGGNAVDAAVAVGLALAVTYPYAGNLGGGGFMVLRTADGRSAAIDFRETAPGAAARDMYLDKGANLTPEASTVGYRAAGVPGTVAGLALALAKYGTLPWREVVEPARSLAAEGFPVSFGLARSLRAASGLLERFPESRRVFLRDGRAYDEGETFRQPDLAATLRRLQERGPREFYEGETARRLAADAAVHGGLITADDLKRYRAVEREPLRGTYRGCALITMPPPSSGGIALIEMLNVLEGYPVKRPGVNSSAGYHLLVEVMRRAFADRAEFPGDPDFARIPVRGLTSKAYAAELRKRIDLARATPSERVGHGEPTAYESTETTHFTVVDAQGSAVATTYTLNGGYGCGATVRGAGFLLNNEMDDFTAKPGAPNLFGLIQGEANSIAPRKRPLSSMTPTLVLKGDRLWFALGSPGGPTIINTVMQVILNVVDHGMNLQQAVNAPRLHHQWQPDRVSYEPFGLSRDVIEALRARGHRIADPAGYLGDVQGVMIDPETGMRLGASDMRSVDGCAVGY